MSRIVWVFPTVIWIINIPFQRSLIMLEQDALPSREGFGGVSSGIKNKFMFYKRLDTFKFTRSLRNP